MGDKFQGKKAKLEDAMDDAVANGKAQGKLERGDRLRLDSLEVTVKNPHISEYIVVLEKLS